MRYGPDHKEQTRLGILAEAAAALRRKGPARVGVAEIMAGVGLTQGGFYAHFSSKDDLIAQAIVQMFDEGYAWFLRKTENLTPQDGLTAFINAYLSRSHRDARGYGCAIAALLGDLPRLPPAARARFTEGAARLPEAIGRLLQQLGLENAEALAYSAVAEMSGALALARAVDDSEQSVQILRNSREMVKMRLGLKPKNGSE